MGVHNVRHSWPLLLLCRRAFGATSVQWQEHIAEIILLSVFAAVTLSLLWASGQKIDAAVFRFFNARGTRTPWLDSIMQTLTELGNSFVTGAVAFFYSHASAPRSHMSSCCLRCFCGCSSKDKGGPEERPFTGLKDVRVVGTRAGKSFPSGHTSQAFIRQLAACVFGRQYPGASYYLRALHS